MKRTILLSLWIATLASSPLYAQQAPSGTQAMGKLQIQVLKLESRAEEFKQAIESWAKLKVLPKKEFFSRFKILSFENRSARMFSARIYDYLGERLVKIEGALPEFTPGWWIKPSSWKVVKAWAIGVTDLSKVSKAARAVSLPIRPTGEEIEEARTLILRTIERNRSASEKSYDIAPAMPGVLAPGTIQQAIERGLVTSVERADGIPAKSLKDTARVLTMSIQPKSKASPVKTEIVGVSLADQSIAHFKFNSPLTAIASAADASAAAPTEAFAANPDRENGSCGLQIDSNLLSIDESTPGSQATIVVKKPDGSPLWQFDVIRPRASSGRDGSGIELQNVSYQGVRVLKRANVPIFNVRYEHDACGPYRDWANQEDRFTADVKTVLAGTSTSGVVETTTMPASLLQSGTDVGNFKGVAIFTDANQNITLMSEMAAGWYRYVSMWVLGADGSIEPKFGFGAVESSCVCNKHYHHAYWRLEFDAKHFEKQTAGKAAFESVDKQETFFREAGDQYRVSNETGMNYEIIPGSRDGSAKQGDQIDKFGKSDVWVMNARDNQMEDRDLSPDDADDHRTSIHINQFLKANPNDTENTKLDQQGLVVWYGAHFTHDVLGGHHEGEEPHEDPHPEPNEGPNDHILGPVIRPVTAAAH